LARLFGEIGEALGVLDDRAGALEAHAGIDVFGGQFAEGAVGSALYWMKTRFQISMQRSESLLTSLRRGVAFGGEVDVEFGAGAAGAGVAHHPEVVLHVAVDDVDGGIAALGAEELGPDVVGFLVEFAGVAGFRA
jgi:hypothetical protein